MDFLNWYLSFLPLLTDSLAERCARFGKMVWAGMQETHSEHVEVSSIASSAPDTLELLTEPEFAPRRQELVKKVQCRLCTPAGNT